MDERQQQADANNKQPEPAANISDAAYPLVSLIARISADLLAADPTYQRLLRDQQPKIPAARLQLHTNVAVALATAAARAVQTAPEPSPDRGIVIPGLWPVRPQ